MNMSARRKELHDIFLSHESIPAATTHTSPYHLTQGVVEEIPNNMVLIQNYELEKNIQYIFYWYQYVQKK